jgi:hypothetical protein
VAIAALLMMGGCGTTNPAPKAQAQVPTDGVHIEGAFAGVYPISSGGKCNIATINTDKLLQFTANAATGAAVGMELIKYTGPKTYAPLDFPPYQRSAMWVRQVGGHTWHAFSGWVKVASDANGTISGTLSSSGMKEVGGGTTTVNASGSWSCQTV